MQHLWEDEIRNKANGGLNTCGSNIYNNIHNNNNNGINGYDDGANHHPTQCKGSDKLPSELFAISFSEQMRRHSTMSYTIVIEESINVSKFIQMNEKLAVTFDR